MSIQSKEYTSKKTGKTTTKYYAVVYDINSNKPIWSKGFSSEREAKREEGRMIHALESNKLVTKKVKFDEVVKMWFNSYKGVYANSTYRGYIWYYNKYIKPVFTGKWINEIDPIHIQRFVDAMSQKYSAETVNKCINILSNIFQHAVNPLKVLNENTASGITRKKVTVQESATWNEEQIASFLNYEKVRASSYYELIVSSFLVGVRPSEVCGLSRNGLDKNRVLQFRQGHDRYGVVSDMKNIKSHRSIQISESHYRLIMNRLEKQEHQKIKAIENDKGYDDNDFMFKQRNGKPINPNNYSKSFKRLLMNYNQDIDTEFILPDICLYGARHSFATNLLLNNDASTALVSKIMGNSERVCAERYVKRIDSVQASVIASYTGSILEQGCNRVS